MTGDDNNGGSGSGNIDVQTGLTTSPIEPSGSIIFATGPATTSSGNITFLTGSGQLAGNIVLETGESFDATNPGGETVLTSNVGQCHIVTIGGIGGNSMTIAVNTGTIDPTSVEAFGNDTAFYIRGRTTPVPPPGPGANLLYQVTFGRPFSQRPIVNITFGTDFAAQFGIYAEMLAGNTGFTINIPTSISPIPGNRILEYNVHCIAADGNIILTALP